MADQLGKDLKGAVGAAEGAQRQSILERLGEPSTTPQAPSPTGMQPEQQNQLWDQANPPSDPTTKRIGNILRQLQEDDGHAGMTEKYGVPEGGDVLSGLSNFFAKLKPSSARGFADSLGLPADIIDGAAAYYKEHPIEGLATKIPVVGGMLAAARGLTNKPPEGSTFEAGGSKNIRRLAGKVGIDTTLPSERGDTSHSGAWAESLGYAVGGALPFSPIGAGAGVARAVASRAPMMAAETIGKSGLKDIALSTAAGGTGRVLADELTERGTPGSKAAEAGGMVAGGALAGGAVAGTKILLTAGMQALHNSATPGIWNLLKGGELGAGGLMRGVSDDPKLAAETALRLGGKAGASELGVPEGFQVPSFAASMDLPIQALGHRVVTKEQFANGEYRKILENNEWLMRGLLTEPGQPGFEETAGFLQQLNQNSIAVKQKLIDNAVKQADVDLEVATKGASLDPDAIEGIKRGYEMDLRGRLVDAWSNANASTQAEFMSARSMGLDQATIPTTRLYDRLADLMSDAITKGMQDHFPQGVLNPIYHKPPLTMMDGRTGGIAAGDITQNYVLGQTAPWERIQGLYNNVNDALATELRKTRPDPVKLGFLNQIQDEVTTSMKDMRMGGKFAPGALPTRLQRALDSAQENRELFVDSPVGSLLGFDKGGMIDPDAGMSIKRWLGNGPQTQAKVNALYDAVGSQSVLGGVHPADALNASIQGFLRQEFADAYRKGGVKAAAKWMDNNDAVMDSSQFTGLKDEFRTALNSRSVAEKMFGDVQPDIDAIRLGRAEAFLNSDPETAFQKALTGPSKFTATREMVQDLKMDPTGRALQGFGNMAFDRMVATASLVNPLNQPGRSFLGASVDEYYKANQGMFNAIGRELPGFRERVESFRNMALAMDRIMAVPKDIPLSAREIEIAGSGMAVLIGKISGAWLGRQFDTGTIQVPGIMSQAVGGAVGRVTKTMKTEQAQALLSRAMIEPELFAQLMQPLKTKEAADMFNMLTEPYILSAPAVVKGTVEQRTEPQQPMEEKRGLFFMPGEAPK